MYKPSSKLILPYLLCLHIVLSSINDITWNNVNIYEVLMLLLLLLAFTFITNFCIHLFFKDRSFIYLLTSFFLLALFYITPLTVTLNYLIPFFQWKYIFTLSLFIILVAYAFFLLKFQKKSFLNKVVSYLTTLLFIFSCLEIYYIAFNYFHSLNMKIKDVKSFKDKEQLKNLYVIVLDGYARIDNLSQYTNYDGSLLKENLKKKGFFVAPRSRANYRFSLQTIGSMFELDYLTPHLLEQNIKLIINSNKTLDILKKKGFDRWYGNAWMDQVDNSLEMNYNNPLPTLRQIIFSKTIFQYLYYHYLSSKKLNGDILDKQKLSVEDALFSKLEEVAFLNTGNPKFVHIHSLITHYNFIIDSLGNKTTLFNDLPYSEICKWSASSNKKLLFRTTGNLDTDRKLIFAYESSIRFSDKRITSLLDRVWSQISQNSVIIIMSDHGFRFFPGKTDDLWKESYENLCAVYYPDKDYSQLYDTITPVNIMRSCLNKAIGTQFEKLPDKIDMK